MKTLLKFISSTKFMLLIIVNIGLICSTLAQTSLTYTLKWDESAPFSYQVSAEEEYFYPNLVDSYFDGASFLWIQRLSSSYVGNYTIKEVAYQSVSQIDKDFLMAANLTIPKSLNYRLKNNTKRGEKFTHLELFPYVQQGNELKKVKSLTLEKIPAATVTPKAGHQFASNSVLAPGSGDWYKIKVTRNGVYKLSYDFLKDIGLNVEQLNPDDVNVFGNGFGKLPESNDVYRPDDLIKNAILVVGGDDGSFDQEDYILFYARGPHKWIPLNNAFRRELNIYANESYYFINVNPNTTPKRIVQQPTVVFPSTHAVSDYNSYTIYEKEEVNLLKGGQRWYGEKFDAELSQSFSFSIPNLNTAEPVIVRSFMATNNGGGGTNYQIRYGSSTIGTGTFGGSSSDSYARTGFTSSPGDFSPTNGNFSLTVRFNRTNPSDYAYLDFIEINARSILRFHGDQFEFRDLNSVGDGNIAEYTISDFPSNGKVWDVTELGNPFIVSGTNLNNQFVFKAEADTLRTYIGFTNSSFLSPTYVGRVEYQNLHALSYADYLIITNSLFLNQAQRLANLHEQSGTTCHVVELEDIYNEFSGGTQDPTAIRFFAKMFYDRAEGDTDMMPKYMCLFGDGTYDPLNRVANNNYMCPVYHTLSSEGYVSTLLSDDYFGFLDDEESFTPTDMLDIAVGRLIATTPQHAIDLVNKIEHYMKNGSNLYAASGVLCDDEGFASTQGDWRLRYTLITDDEENGYFIVNDLEPAYNYVEENHPEMNANKIYMDAYPQISTAGGQRYPDVNAAIDRSVEAGTVLMCYVGHGGPAGAAQERIITIGQINDWTNVNKLNLFVSATCEFARIDDNEEVSAGEWMALNPIGGAIALMTTTRAVYFSTNSITTDRFFENVFLRDAENKPRTFGDIITSTKNAIPGVSNNKRSFMLLGDPALRIALPYEEVVLDSINGVSAEMAADTLKALSKVRLSGHLEDQFGNQLNSFNGVLQPSIFDKKRTVSTLGQDTKSPIIAFEERNNVLYKGNVSVKNGLYSFDFIVPRDINYNFGIGKASFYAFDENNNSAGGFDSTLVIGGIDTTGLNDAVGPQIELFLNEESFVNGGITNERPILIAKLFDENGINTVGTGIGHDITMVLNNETSRAIVLNDFYESDLDTYKSGRVRYQLDQLEPGNYTLTFKAWDVNNNSSEQQIEFVVQESTEIVLNQVLNYPNPFTTHTEFMFEHNQVCAFLEVQVEVFTVTGRLVRTIETDVKTQGFRAGGIPWDGRDEYGDQLAKGVYVYRISVRNPEGETAQAMQKLYLLK